MSIIKVAAKSRTFAVAGAIAGVIREKKEAEIQAIGAGAVNQAVKAIAIASDYLREEAVEIFCQPELVDLIIDEQERTAVKFIVTCKVG